jgi:hypothetical protein
MYVLYRLAWVNNPCKSHLPGVRVEIWLTDHIPGPHRWHGRRPITVHRRPVQHRDHDVLYPLRRFPPTPDRTPRLPHRVPTASLTTNLIATQQIIFQFPANIVIRKLGAALWLSSLVVAWGGVTVGMGFTTDWTQLLGCRIILGVLEAGYFPGCVFLLSCW